MININIIKKKKQHHNKVISFINNYEVNNESYLLKKPHEILFFPELTFKQKFNSETIEDLLSNINPICGVHAFICAYVLKTEEEVDDEVKEYCTDQGLNYNTQEPFMKSIIDDLHKQTYVPKGYLISNNDGLIKINQYDKHLITQLDNINATKNTNITKAYTFFRSNIQSRTCYLDDDRYYSKKVDFPTINVDNKEIEFRICADIQCNTKNNPDLILTSAHKLLNENFKINNNSSNIINDAGHFRNLTGIFKNKQYKNIDKINEILKDKDIKLY